MGDIVVASFVRLSVYYFFTVMHLQVQASWINRSMNNGTLCSVCWNSQYLVNALRSLPWTGPFHWHCLQVQQVVCCVSALVSFTDRGVRVLAHQYVHILIADLPPYKQTCNVLCSVHLRTCLHHCVCTCMLWVVSTYLSSPLCVCVLVVSSVHLPVFTTVCVLWLLSKSPSSPLCVLLCIVHIPGITNVCAVRIVQV